MSMSPWIKLCHDTPRKPEILEIADLLGISRLEAFGLAMEFWIWVDSHSKGGELRRLRVSHVDAALSHSGLASALLSVGWLAQDDEGNLSVPNFDRHSGGTAKDRALRTERNARHRQQVRRERDASETVSETHDRLANVSLSSSSSSSCIQSLRSKDQEASEAKPTAPRKTRRLDGFDRFYEAYPRRISRGDAEKAWAKIPPEEREQVIEAAKEFATAKAGSDPTFLPYPAKWLNGRRWLDDRTEWRAAANGTRPIAPTGSMFSPYDREQLLRGMAEADAADRAQRAGK